MRINPIAIGIEVVPTERPVMNAGAAGAKYPIAIPMIIARNIQRVRYVSRNDSRLFVDIGSPGFYDLVKRSNYLIAVIRCFNRKMLYEFFLDSNYIHLSRQFQIFP